MRGAIYEGTKAGGAPTGEDIEQGSEVADHACFVAGTLISTDKGDVAIEDIRVGDRVLTRNGYFPVRDCGLTSSNASVLDVALSNGKILTGTGNHPVWSVSAQDWTRLDALRYGIKLHGAGRTERTTKSALALLARRCFLSTGITRQKPAPVSVVQCNVAGRKAVYNLSVSGAPEFYANGVLVHNCDALRYCLASTFRIGFSERDIDPYALRLVSTEDEELAA